MPNDKPARRVIRLAWLMACGLAFGTTIGCQSLDASRSMISRSMLFAGDAHRGAVTQSNSAKLLEQAVTESTNRDFSTARSLLAKLLKDDPENTSALDLLADVATRQADWPLLRATLRRRARIDSNSAIVQNRVGLELINSVRQQRGRQSQTESGIQQAAFDFDSDHTCDSANTEPARVIADGITLLHRAVQLEPRNTDFVQHLVGALAQEGRDAEALGVIRRALDANPTNATLAIMAARMLDAENDWASAIFYYDMALQNDPQNRIWHRHRAMCLYRQGSYARASADFEIALTGTPVEFQIAEHLAWANSYLLQGKPDLTVQLLNRIIETDGIRTPEIEALRMRCQAQMRVER